MVEHASRLADIRDDTLLVEDHPGERPGIEV